jgi:Fe2+ or Zn2+ uptake regulation protein
MTCTPAHAAEQIRGRGFRMTSQRLVILDVLRRSRGHLAPAEIYKRVRAEMPGMTESTVYRNLDFLVQNTFATAIQARGGRLKYELAQDEHHHVVCRSCGRQVELPSEQVAKLCIQLEKSTGYRLSDSHMTLTGLCPRCKAKGA